MAKRLILARHAETAGRYTGRFVGRTEAKLTDEAPAQAARLAKLINRYTPGRTFQSPSLRVRKTVELLGAKSELGTVEVDSDLREINFGRWENRSFAEITAGDPGLVTEWSSRPEEFRFPEGERMTDFLERTARAARRLADRPEETVLAVTHGGVIRAVICHLLGLPPRHYLLFDVKPARLCVLDLFSEGGIMAGFNL